MMNSRDDAASAALAEVDRLRTALKKKSSAQVRNRDEQGLVKATALTWFNIHQKALAAAAELSEMREAGELYRHLLDASDRHTSRKSYLVGLKSLRNVLIALRTSVITAPGIAPPGTSDQPPDFRALASPDMQAVLVGRWDECTRCIAASAPMAATVMMGGLLETLLLARVNLTANKAPIFTASNSPKDKGGKTLGLSDWGLKDYIAVAHELKWISVSARDVAVVLRDFRNYIHPNKQLSHGVHLTDDDAVLFWEVSKTITRQLLKNAKP
jgi:hypothetical protein